MVVGMFFGGGKTLGGEHFQMGGGGLKNVKMEITQGGVENFHR